MKAKVFLFLMVVLLWAGCTGSEQALVHGVKVKIRGVSDHAALNGRISEATASESTEATGIVINEAMLGVKELEFELTDEEDNDDGDFYDDDNSDPGDGDRHDGDGDNDNEGDNDEIEFKGAFIVDLIAGTSTPDFGIAEVVPGRYEEIEIKLSPILPDSNSVFIAFSFINTGGDTVQVELSTKRSLEIEIEDDDGFEISDHVFNDILVLVDLDMLLSGMDLTQATVDPNGVIIINDSTNATILSHILSNFKDSCHAGEDDDHDDDIDDD